MDENLPVKDKALYTDALLEAIESIPEEYHDQTEEDLRAKFDPTLKLYEIKQKFWTELTMASDAGRKMCIQNIFTGVVSKEYFYRKVMKNHLKMAWLIHPLTTYENRIDAALMKATERYADLINMDIMTTKKRKDENGEWFEYQEVDAKKAGVLLAVIKQLEDRKLGVSVQRQINVNQTETKPADTPVDADKIDDRLKEIETQLGQMGDVIDV